MFGLGSGTDKKVRYEIIGRFVISGVNEAAIDKEIRRIEGQVKTLQAMRMTGIESWSLVEKKKIE